MYFKLQVDIWIYCMRTVLISSLCVLELVLKWNCQEGNGSDVIRSVAMKFRMIKHQRVI
jgi:hypothetical protein